MANVCFLLGADAAGKSELEVLYQLHGVLADHRLLENYVAGCTSEMAVLQDTVTLHAHAHSRALKDATLRKKQLEYDHLLKK